MSIFEALGAPYFSLSLLAPRATPFFFFFYDVIDAHTHSFSSLPPASSFPLIVRSCCCCCCHLLSVAYIHLVFLAPAQLQSSTPSKISSQMCLRDKTPKKG